MTSSKKFKPLIVSLYCHGKMASIQCCPHYQMKNCLSIM